MIIRVVAERHSASVNASVIRRVVVGVGAAASVVVLAACSSSAASDPTAASSSEVEPFTVAAPDELSENGESMLIDIQVGDRIVVGTLNDNAASRDLAAQLPLTVTMSDHGSVEKTGPLPARLSTAGSPPSADPNPGDIGYYAPGNDFVLYYGDQSEFPGIVILGSMDDTGSGVVGSTNGDVTVTLTRSQSR